ncbi:MAG: Cof-type HAD-IIB family hydrolase [Prevotellaceae bacterium]|jgi:Cof subfamily protein (haloacid dehalogenase superfamily)|nr:Cof-type HAD-IIB family hydrolase [Prevotellaceae bacterium]
MIKAIFFDIDGTLVSFHTHVIPQSAIRAIAAAHAKGVKIFIATGRPGVIINNLSALQERNLIDGYITMNGAYCLVGDEVVYKSAIPAADVHTLAQLSVARNFPCIFVGEHDLCLNRPDRQVQQVFLNYLEVTSLPVKEPSTIGLQDIYQMTPFITTAQEQEILPLLHGCESNRWFPAFADLTACGNTKQHGIDEIVRRFGLPLQETMAFGDGGNDTGMLQHAGIGIAMGNAADEVKRYADYVTDTVDNDGIVKALLHFGIVSESDLSDL